MFYQSTIKNKLFGIKHIVLYVRWPERRKWFSVVRHRPHGGHTSRIIATPNLKKFSRPTTPTLNKVRYFFLVFSFTVAKWRVFTKRTTITKRYFKRSKSYCRENVGNIELKTSSKTSVLKNKLWQWLESRFRLC